jgi:hypothetical protein
LRHLVERTPDVVVPGNDPLDGIPDKVDVDRIREGRIQFGKVEKVLVLQEGAALRKNTGASFFKPIFEFWKKFAPSQC